MANTCELAQRNTIRAFRSGPKVVIVAEGDLPSPGYDAKITQRPEKIFPPWYQVLRCPRPGFFPAVVVPYRVSLTINHPEDRDVVTVFHADGKDEVKIEACGDELAAYSAVVGGGGCPEGADEATGFSKAELRRGVRGRPRQTAHDRARAPRHARNGPRRRDRRAVRRDRRLPRPVRARLPHARLTRYFSWQFPVRGLPCPNRVVLPEPSIGTATERRRDG
jgi:hypothetical protein